MNHHVFEWAASPVLHLLLLSLGLWLCLYLFITLKRDIFHLVRRHKAVHANWECSLGEQNQAMSTALEEQSQALGELRQELREVSERVSLLSPSAPPAQGINLVKRTQVLQMARRGNRPDQIATCLHVPQNEVDLVLKVQRTIAKAI